MAINMFEGARRIAKVIAGVAVIITVFVGYDAVYWVAHRPVVLDYPFLIQHEGATPVRIAFCSPEMEFIKDVAKTTSDGIEVKAGLCLSSQVNPFTVFDEIKFSEADEDMIRGIRRSAMFDEFMDYAFNLIAGLAGFWVFTWAVGWIVRGFIGIPRGMDRKP